jgi:hypothetical protein
VSDRQAERAFPTLIDLFKRMPRDERSVDYAAANQMFLDDPLEDRRIALRVPRAFGINDGDWAALADAEAIRFRPQNAALLSETELLQPALEKLPCREAPIFLAAFRVRLIAAEKDVTARHLDADTLRDRALRLCSHQPSALSP